MLLEAGDLQHVSFPTDLAPGCRVLGSITGFRSSVSWKVFLVFFHFSLSQASLLTRPPHVLAVLPRFFNSIWSSGHSLIWSDWLFPFGVHLHRAANLLFHRFKSDWESPPVFHFHRLRLCVSPAGRPSDSRVHVFHLLLPALAAQLSLQVVEILLSRADFLFGDRKALLKVIDLTGKSLKHGTPHELSYSLAAGDIATVVRKQRGRWMLVMFSSLSPFCLIWSSGPWWGWCHFSHLR